MKHSRIIIISIVALFLLADSVLAAPIYDGPTYGASGLTGEYAGYYITSDKTGSNWSVNWTSGDTDSEDFFGYIEVEGEIYVDWDQVGVYTVHNTDRLDFISNSSSDGFNFNIGSTGNNITFNLGSSADSFGIYAGEGENPITDYYDQWYVGDDFEGGLKFFEIAPAPVPEPATMFLLGSGLFGLAGFGRKRFTKKG